MRKFPLTHIADLRGGSRLVIDGVLGLTQLVEAMHHTIASRPGVLAPLTPQPTRGITGFTYRSIRRITSLVGSTLDTTLGLFQPAALPAMPHAGREAMVAVLNGVLGDHLAVTHNPLAITMRIRQNGQALQLDAAGLAGIAEPSGKLLIMVHGLCMNDLQWGEPGRVQEVTPASQLAESLGHTPLYLHYNSGRHLSSNGREFAALLEELLANWPVPVEQISILAHSMGGLISRSALHYGQQAGMRWPSLLRQLVFLGTPHLGAPLERGGNWIDFLLGISPYSRPLARLGKVRSAGITDMRYGSLLDEDWQGLDRFARRQHLPSVVPLPNEVSCYAIAATTGKRRGDLGDWLLGDGLVPVESALGQHSDPARCLQLAAERQWLAYGMNHFALLYHPEVYQQLRHWLLQADQATNPGC